MSLAEHGNSTDPQKYTYLTLSSIFWITVMLIGTLSITFKGEVDENQNFQTKFPEKPEMMEIF